MIIALALVGYSLLLATVIPPILFSARWVDRAPRIAIMSWHALTGTVLATTIMAGLSLTIPTPHVSRHLAEFFQACAMSLRLQYASPGGWIFGLLGGLLAVGVIGRVTWFLTVASVNLIRERARHRRILDIVGRIDVERGIVILDCDESTVYCVSGRRSRTVVTTAALGALNDYQLKAVLAHENAHLTERHDLALALSNGLAKAFSGLTLFPTAAAEIARLVELRADDVAAAQTDRLTVADALLAVVPNSGSQARPAMALFAGGDGTAIRVRRLIPPSNPLSRIQSTAGILGVAIILSMPLLILGGPAAAAIQQDLCPSTSTSAAH